MNTGTFYDYDNQAWVKNGRYVKCGHPSKMTGCYACEHAGEEAPESAARHWDENGCPRVPSGADIATALDSIMEAV